ncbi:hypothetical protein DPMN_070629 [Dreissena polymorpha]|uniref:Uncharacterized protein n=1 Tax=Dreissena polymorpha TaxID=45954 RepID=A0A9D3Z3G4_DREPO|nr:hypothetical protein DPMN_070629 [Dreissena polymorpha]
MSESKGVTKRKRMSNGEIKEYHYSKSRKQFELVFESDSEKLAFETRLENLKKENNIKSTKDLFEYLMNKDSSKHSPSQTKAEINSSDKTSPSSKHDLFICDYRSLFSFVTKIFEHQKICRHDLAPKSLNQSGHVAETEWTCTDGHVLIWNSSRQLGTQYMVNYRMMLAYLCSGITNIQYERFSEFGDIGVLSHRFRLRSSLTFSAVISVLCKESVQFALQDEVQLAKDKQESGISIMTDARHHCRKNSYHTDHVALGMYSHKVVNIQHITKTQDSCTQRHETIGCEDMYRDFKRQNINVNIHSHDRNQSVNKSIRNKDNVQNCNERWHAAKSIMPGIKKISSGAQKNMGVTWHPELSDKGARLRNHIFYSLDNCKGCPARLRSLIDNSVNHFQNNHENCQEDSQCKTVGYVPDYAIIRSPVAV